MIPPEERLGGARRLIEQFGYFVVHAPRQTGKTTTLMAMARTLTREGKLACLYLSCEEAEVAGDDFPRAEKILLDTIRLNSETGLSGDLRPPERWPVAEEGKALGAGLSAWARRCRLPLVLFFDEIDALRGNSLISVLRQLRSGYPSRPGAFPASVVLCGLRDVRDYKAASGGNPSRLGTSSPFNIKVKSLKLGYFGRGHVADLFGQHTRETGRIFDTVALDRVMELSGGQPWLVNALAKEVVEEMAVPASEPVTVHHIEEAKERLILARATHLDSLVARLHEDRVRRVVEPLVSGGLLTTADTYDDDISYLRDLGLVAADNPVRMANPIYREVTVRVLSGGVEGQVTTDPRTFVLPDGRLDFPMLLMEFAAFWKEHGEILATGMTYHEAAPQLVLMAFLQRVVNGGGYIDREYGVGRGRIDLLLRWPYNGSDGKRLWQREALELKVRAEGKPDPLNQGLAQLDGYLDGLGLDTGVLVIFDRRNKSPSVARRTRIGSATTPAGRKVTVLRA